MTPRLRLRTLALALLVSAAPVSAATPEEQCEIAKNNAAGKYALCRQKAEAKAIAKGTAPDLTKCDAQLAKAWQKADDKAAKAGITCPDALPTADIQAFVTDHSDAVAAAVAGGGLPDVPAPECAGPYLTLDEANRSVSFNDGDNGIELCDGTGASPAQSPDWNGAGWYRIAGPAGTALPEATPGTYACGTDAPGWLNGAHPSVADGIVSRQVCFDFFGDPCSWSTDVNVLNCGSFYLYELPEAPEECLRYCGQ